MLLQKFYEIMLHQQDFLYYIFPNDHFDLCKITERNLLWHCKRLLDAAKFDMHRIAFSLKVLKCDNVDWFLGMEGNLPNSIFQIKKRLILYWQLPEIALVFVRQQSEWPIKRGGDTTTKMTNLFTISTSPNKVLRFQAIKP